MKVADFPEVHNLPVQEKLELVDELWLSMKTELDSLEVTNEARELLDERWRAFLADTGSALTVEEFRAFTVEAGVNHPSLPLRLLD